MSEETNVQCPACTAELPLETVECPWCGHLMTPRVEAILLEELAQQQEEGIEPEPIPLPAEPAQPPVPSDPAKPIVPEAAVFPVAEPGLTEIAHVPGRAPASNLKVMGIILTIFSFLALLFFAFQVFQDKLPTLVLLVPIFGMMVGLISVAVGQKR